MESLHHASLLFYGFFCSVCSTRHGPTYQSSTSSQQTAEGKEFMDEANIRDLFGETVLHQMARVGFLPQINNLIHGGNFFSEGYAYKIKVSEGNTFGNGK